MLTKDDVVKYFAPKSKPTDGLDNVFEGIKLLRERIPVDV